MKSTFTYPSTIAPAALATGALLVAMFGLSLVTGVNQQSIEVVHGHDEYIRLLKQGENQLRIILALDGLFIVAYWFLGLMLAMSLWNTKPRLLLSISMACISLTALLDIVENNMFLMFIQSINSGVTIEMDDVQNTMVIGAVKWTCAYSAFFFLGFAFPTETVWEKWAAVLMRFAVLPVGMLVFTIPPSQALVMAHLLRVVLLLVLLGMFVVIGREWSKNVSYSS